ncbi:MAG: hypothetical protein WA751_09970 [Candidatus Dormiibacterota bacterium]
MSIGLEPLVERVAAAPQSDTTESEIVWWELASPEYIAASWDDFGAGSDAVARKEAPRFRLLQGPVNFEYDPDDRPTRKLVRAREDPEVV